MTTWAGDRIGDSVARAALYAVEWLLVTRALVVNV